MGPDLTRKWDHFRRGLPLIRKIFDNQEFTRRNVIAAEVEKVIDALVSRSFNRDDFQKSLDRFYVAIENAAHRGNSAQDRQVSLLSATAKKTVWC